MHVLKGRGGLEGVGHHAGQHHDVLTDLHLVVERVKEGFEVLWILVGVNSSDDLEEHHLTRPQQPQGRLSPLARIALFGGNDSKVVEACFQWKVDAPDVPMLELQHGRELTTDGLAEVAVFHGRQTNDGGRKDGVRAAGDGGDVKDGVLPCQRIEAVVVAERTLQLGFGRVAVAFDDDVGLGWHPEVLGQGLRDRE